MTISWCKVASNLDTHPKVRRAGRLGREIFLFALRRNAEPGNPIPGRIPKDELDPDYVADLLQMPRDEAVTGVTCAVTAGLLVEEGAWYLIASWKDGWGKAKSSGAERTAKWRENKRVTVATSRGDTGDTRDSAEGHGDGRDTDKKRGEEINKSPDKRDASLSLLLILKIIGNHPRHALSRLSESEKEKKVRKWADHVRLMREVDGHTEDEIKTVINWCQADVFWKANIQSTETLRRQWDTLVAQMARTGAAPKPAVRQIEQPALEFPIGDCE